jgi:hypothetical protein
MAGKDIIMATQGELKCLHMLRKAIERVITQKEVAATVDLSERQVRRKIKRLRLEGDPSIVHGLRGKASNRSIPDRKKEKVLRLFKGQYSDFGPTLASEKLFERDKIQISDETLRLWLIREGIPYRKRKKRPHRQWRERRAQYGHMIQMDGSEHDWFEGRGPKCVLMGYIDDATGKPFGRFYLYEGTIPAMDSFKKYIRKRGIPLSVYLDKHATYKSTKRQTMEEELADQEALSQFGRALKGLGVEIIYAHSPQAKGRVERLFRTFQDRLIKEMRLAGISSIEQANIFLAGYLPVYAKRFAVTPRIRGDLHRPIPKGLDLNRILCIKTKRSLRNDFTVAHEKKLYQIIDNVRTRHVMVEEHINGALIIRHKETTLRFKEITARPKESTPPDEQKHGFKLIRRHVPGTKHPWKQNYPQNYTYSQKEKRSKKEKELLLTK